MGADSCLGLEKLFRQSGIAASWTDGAGWQVSETLLATSHIAADFDTSKALFHHFYFPFSAERMLVAKGLPLSCTQIAIIDALGQKEALNRTNHRHC